MGGLIYRGGKKAEPVERNCGSRHNGMKAVLVIAMCLMALALATTHETSDERGIIINLVRALKLESKQLNRIINAARVLFWICHGT